MNGRAHKIKIPSSDKVMFESNLPKNLPSALNQSMGSSRTLYFHTGTHKTGSSALQAYLCANKQLISKTDTSYEFPSGTEQTMGNGQYFYDQLYERNMSDSQLEELLEVYLGGRKTAICSSEDFTRFRYREWRQVIDACQRLLVQVKVVTFVRDIGPYYFSIYGQLIKGGEYFTSFLEFCGRDQYGPSVNSIKCLIDLVGRESMSVIHYESVSAAMDIAFMKAVELTPEHFDSSPLKIRINRSLTEYELEILSHINESCGRQYSLELSKLLMERHPHLKPVKHLETDIIAMLNERHTADVKWLNHTFFEGKEVVKISGDAINNTPNGLSAKEIQAIDHDVANWCISKLQSAQSESIKYASVQLHAIDWKNAGNPVIPNNFDPIAYLLLNPDVLKAGMPPYEHFIISGQYENGRVWKWPNQ
jgi:hypothetical protein